MVKSFLVVFFAFNLQIASASTQIYFNNLQDQSKIQELSFSEQYDQIKYINSNIQELTNEQKIEFYYLAAYFLLYQDPIESLSLSKSGLLLSKSLGLYAKEIFFKSNIIHANLLSSDSYSKLDLIDIESYISNIDESRDNALILLVYSKISNLLENRFEQLHSLRKGVGFLKTKSINTPENMFILGEYYIGLGLFYQDMRDYENSKKYLEQAHEEFLKINSLTKIGVIKFYLGKLAFKERKYKDSIAYFKKVIEIKSKLNEQFGYGLGHSNLSKVYNEIGNHKLALEHIETALPILEKIGSKYRLANAYHFYCQIQNSLGNEQKAIDSIIKSLEFAKKNSPSFQKIKIFETALNLLKGEKYQEQKNTILSEYLNEHAFVIEARKKDIQQRIEAESKINQQYFENQLLHNNNQIQKDNLNLQKSLNSKQRILISTLVFLVITLFFSIFKLFKTNKRNTYLANTDYLTGISNRRNFFKTIKQYFQRRKIGELKSAYLILIDVDYFKNINDRLGHDVGDIVLKELCSLIDGSMEQCISFARVGGEEFAILSEFNDDNHAFNVVDKMRLLVEEHHWKFKQENASISVTISLGMSNLKKELELEDIIKNADKALYAAKKNGRNRTEFIRS